MQAMQDPGYLADMQHVTQAATRIVTMLHYYNYIVSHNVIAEYPMVTMVISADRMSKKIVICDVYTSKIMVKRRKMKFQFTSQLDGEVTAVRKIMRLLGPALHQEFYLFHTHLRYIPMYAYTQAHQLEVIRRIASHLTWEQLQYLVLYTAKTQATFIQLLHRELLAICIEKMIHNNVDRTHFYDLIYCSQNSDVRHYLELRLDPSHYEAFYFFDKAPANSIIPMMGAAMINPTSTSDTMISHLASDDQPICFLLESEPDAAAPVMSASAPFCGSGVSASAVSDKL